MAIGFIPAVADLDPKQFDALDRTAGFASSHTRLRQKEQDPRWISRCLEWTDGGRLRAAIPFYRSRMSSWPDKAYDPRRWGLPDDAGSACSPAATLLVGGCGDRRTGLHVDAEAGSPGTLRDLLGEIARVAAAEDRCLAFPYLHAEARTALAAATGDRVIWTAMGREGHVFGLSATDWESRLPAKARNTLRRDHRRMAETGVLDGERLHWDEVAPWAAELISHQHSVKDDPEIPEFVAFRYADLRENPDFDVFVFTARSPGLLGVSTVVVWEDELEVLEVGLRGEDSDERLAVYASILFHQPFRYARAQGIDHIRLGSTSETAKAARGAVFTECYAGVLGADETRRLALGSSR